MTRFRGVFMWVAALVWLAMGASCAHAADGDTETSKAETVAPIVKICPLDQVWALDMPGTRDVKELDGSLAEEAQRAIGHSTPGNLETKPAFAVQGTRIDALRAAHAIFTGKEFADKSAPLKIFPEESNVSVVFFSAKSRFPTQLDRVERQGKVVNIYYRFASNESSWTLKPPQLALISLGKLSSGKYRVNVIESPMDRKFDGRESLRSHEEVLRHVGNSFSFFVSEQSAADQGPNEVGGKIYLDEIWAYSQPGTRDIRKLIWGKHPIKSDGGFIAEIRRSLSNVMPKGTEAKAGFAVRGIGLDALRQAHRVIVEGEEPCKEFTVGDEISVAFFSYLGGPYVHLHEAERRGRKVEIRYRFVPHETMELTVHLALIPLGKLPSGKYRVNIVRFPMEQRMIDLGFTPVSEKNARRIACKSFSFSVEEKGE